MRSTSKLVLAMLCCCYEYIVIDFLFVLKESVKKSARGVSDASSWVSAKERALLLSAALSSGLHLLHPIAPFVTEYLYSTLRAARLPVTCSAGMTESSKEHSDELAQYLCLQQFPQVHN